MSLSISFKSGKITKSLAYILCTRGWE